MLQSPKIGVKVPFFLPMLVFISAAKVSEAKYNGSLRDIR
jgi:hypothetical protein